MVDQEIKYAKIQSIFNPSGETFESAPESEPDFDGPEAA